MAENEDPKLKAAFAAFYVDSTEETPQRKAWDAANRLLPREKDTGERCRIAFAWPDDPDVILEIQRLQKVAPKADGTPSKQEVIKEMWLLAKNERTLPKDRAMLGRLVAEMMGYIAKGEDTEAKVMPREPTYRIVEK